MLYEQEHPESSQITISVDIVIYITISIVLAIIDIWPEGCFNIYANVIIVNNKKPIAANEEGMNWKAITVECRDNNYNIACCYSRDSPLFMCMYMLLFHHPRFDLSLHSNIKKLFHHCRRKASTANSGSPQNVLHPSSIIISIVCMYNGIIVLS